ncbi:hypothetical protein SAMN05421853_108134 [Roseivivax halotolerans]|uniref:AAA+ family ATPase n=1 Tax=Roseivivax halotolerans TaxID=93684 RepID=A0A1I5Z986_9RHOB|nr:MULTISPECIES: hypothetical protein [Roseivivax]QFT62923.1 hypothetical protein FIU91_08320 [Roseivivax sp. THAF30]SFQ52935.1 hypothetical protein SAMN05421853_108134 [Roseivivax halotolerans]
MKQFIAAITALCLTSAPLAAQEAEEGEGFSLMERGMQLFFDGLMQEAEPAFDELRRIMEGIEPALSDFVAEMGPALREVLEEVEDWSNYHPPEILENGDIIIRRKTPEELDAMPEADPGESIEL